MATDITIDLATLRFDGESFKGHALDVECMQELITYRNLIVELKAMEGNYHPLGKMHRLIPCRRAYSLYCPMGGYLVTTLSG